MFAKQMKTLRGFTIGVAAVALMLALVQTAPAGVVSVFNSSTTWTPTASGTIELLVVGGGGGAWDAFGAGGGGGGVSYGTFAVTFGTTYTVTVGAGGMDGTDYDGVGSDGGDSTFTGGALTLTATGGKWPTAGRHSTAGASGSGTRNGVFVSGFAGGDGKTDASGPGYAGGGGGGATAVGLTPYNASTPYVHADGGAGILLSDILGGVFSGGTGDNYVAAELAGGGGGGGNREEIYGRGVYGGGDGAWGDGGGWPGFNGTANTGGGGGGDPNDGHHGEGMGGSGLVALSFVPEPATMALLGLGGLGVLLRRKRK
jgi:hypothetical protein